MIGGCCCATFFARRCKLVFTSAAQRDHQPFTKWLIRRMDAVIATSGRVRQLPRSAAYGDPARHRPRRISSAHRTAKTRFAASGLPGKHAVGCFGRVRHQKGTDLFVDAMIALLPEFPDWTAVMTGRVTVEHQAFARRARAPSRRGGPCRPHRLSRRGARHQALVPAVSLYVAPSRNEGFGLTPLEAMASGVAGRRQRRRRLCRADRRGRDRLCRAGRRRRRA